MNSKKWLLGWLAFVLGILSIIFVYVYRIDPYFHFHKPLTNDYWYSLDNQRSQNDGIIKNFNYDALITGTSMTENFKTSEMDELFGVTSIKVPYSGGTYKEINDNLRVALKHNLNLKMVVRCLDMGMFFDDSERMREDLGTYPTYLYDNNPFNDVKYIFNRDIIFDRVYSVFKQNEADQILPGITSFDEYARWQYYYEFGKDAVIPIDTDVRYCESLEKNNHLSDEEKKTIRDNITLNVTQLPDQYADVEFYYFLSPYSIVWWRDKVSSGMLNKQLEAEKYIIELILEHENIYLYSFNNRTDIITDLNNYKDITHYGQWVNSLILKWMKDGEYRITKDNYIKYLEDEFKFYSTFDYSSINLQEDYENDFLVAAMLNKELTGVEPLKVLEAGSIEVTCAQLLEEEQDGVEGILCKGSLQRKIGDDIELSDYLLGTEYIGAKFTIEELGYNYLFFKGRKVLDHGQPTVYVYDENNQKISEMAKNYCDIDEQWHSYAVELPKTEGKVTVILNGGYIDCSGSEESAYMFSDIILY